MKRSDVIVVGSGMAGLTAAIAAAKAGASVSVLSEGSGVIAIGSGAVDFLGYDNGSRIDGDPFGSLSNLPSSHPYSLVGADFIKKSFEDFISVCRAGGLEMSVSENGRNKTVITVAGTLRPTYISTEAFDAESVFHAEKIAFVGVDWLKDTQPSLAVGQMKRYKALQNKTIEKECLPSPFGKTHRVMNCLDYARYVDKTEGAAWLETELLKIKKDYDVILIPPICGVERHCEIFRRIRSRGLNIVETVSIPPGVGGNRLLFVLMKAAKKLGVVFVENCFVARAVVSKGRCSSLVALHRDISGAVETEYFADSFVMATGGILGGGITVSPGKVEESVFNIKIDTPGEVCEWSDKDVFDVQPFALFGVRVSSSMRPVNGKGKEMYSNVFFAGRSLSGYDFTREKSGYGVSIVTGRKAALEAAAFSMAGEAENVRQ